MVSNPVYTILLLNMIPVVLALWQISKDISHISILMMR